jgi:murein DD-endopeptidase MepM/ murein hydrolase activator NlpD
MPALRVHLQRTVVLLAVACLVLAGVITTAAAAQPWTAPLGPVSVTRAFAAAPNPYAPGHRGVDLAGVVGETVVAAEGGQVSYAADLAGRGVVAVVHGGLRTTYEPVRAIVKRGAHVRRGQEIGTLEPGHPRCPVSACLHWGLLRGPVYLDPMTMLRPTKIRLLPLTDTPSEDTVIVAPVSHAAKELAPLEAPGSWPGPLPIAWSVAAFAGGGMIFALRRR